MILTKSDFAEINKKELKIDYSMNKPVRSRIIVVNKSKSNEKPIEELVKIFDPNHSLFPNLKIEKSRGRKNIILPKLTIKIKESKVTSGEKNCEESANSAIINSPSTKDKSTNISLNDFPVDEQEGVIYVPKSYKQTQNEKFLSHSEQVFSDIYEKPKVKFDKFAQIFHPDRQLKNSHSGLINNSMIYSLLNKKILHTDRSLSNMKNNKSETNRIIHNKMPEFPYTQQVVKSYNNLNNFRRKVKVSEFKIMQSKSEVNSKSPRRIDKFTDKVCNLEFNGKMNTIERNDSNLNYILKRSDKDLFMKMLFSKMGQNK